MIEDGEQAVKVLDNPLATTEPVVLNPREIVERQRAQHSIMPQGLLEKLTREEILDLVAYVATRRNADDALFDDEHDHAHGGR